MDMDILLALQTFRKGIGGVQAMLPLSNNGLI